MIFLISEPFFLYLYISLSNLLFSAGWRKHKWRTGCSQSIKKASWTLEGGWVFTAAHSTTVAEEETGQDAGWLFPEVRILQHGHKAGTALRHPGKNL